MTTFAIRWLGLPLIFVCSPGLAASGSEMAQVLSVDLSLRWVGWACVGLFVAAYTLVILEEKLHLKKSIPVLMAAGLIWTLIGYAAYRSGASSVVETALEHSFLEFAELFFFLLVAMTYINTLEERGAFAVLQSRLVSRGYSLRTIFWLTGLLAFVISPIADNMTTALVMASVAMAVGQGHPKFVLLACINIVVAANAGGAFSPFGDITTLMVWQKGIVPAQDFLVLLLPSAVNWLVPAAILSWAIGSGRPEPMAQEARLLPGGLTVIAMFLATIAITVVLHAWLHFPPVLGMMGGLGLLKLYSFDLNRRNPTNMGELLDEGGLEPDTSHPGYPPGPINTFHQVARAEWDTLLFFYGIILCVGGLGVLGYLGALSQLVYTDMGPAVANVLVGVFSAVVDNIPVMYAVLTMNPAMSEGHWLLVTLTAGTGGSMLAVGSAAGVAVMGQARGIYTFMAHLKWSWAIALGYAASIAMHYWLNGSRFL